ncbi:conserved hypothetical protein [Thiomonas sp. X19]|uniref:hypothetical protein n=1 Tax=Thiomonas sp. X19 TaxID=1050370 RepID=UPI000B6DFF56|nr:hypothetical protein [Thiomonas sp. X19]SCC95240.1 conserved hypothetical protein [Thiomonas sp. X19]
MQNEDSGDVLVAILDNIGQIDNACIAMKCPAHAGVFTSSLEVTLKAGRLSMHCMCGCPEDRILAAALGTGQEQPSNRFEEFIDALAA